MPFTSAPGPEPRPCCERFGMTIGFDDPETNPALLALRALVEEIEASAYIDAYGNPLVLNAAYLEARELVRGIDPGGPVWT